MWFVLRLWDAQGCIHPHTIVCGFLHSNLDIRKTKNLENREEIKIAARKKNKAGLLIYGLGMIPLAVGVGLNNGALNEESERFKEYESKISQLEQIEKSLQGKRLEYKSNNLEMGFLEISSEINELSEISNVMRRDIERMSMEPEIRRYEERKDIGLHFILGSTLILGTGLGLIYRGEKDLDKTSLVRRPYEYFSRRGFD